MIEVKNEEGEKADWWFIYKTPKLTGRKDNKGFDYFYYDDTSKKLDLSKFKLNEKKGALHETLEGIFTDPSDDVGYIVYNDEHATKVYNKSEKGHCKGILAFDKKNDRAVFLLYSTPRFPGKNEVTLPKDEEIYGQTYICITLPNYKTANQIAEQMLSQQNPQILTESSKLPKNINNDEALFLLYNGKSIAESKTPSTISFKSKAGKDFQLIAKSRFWGKDFWIDLVSPELKTDLVVETWRRGTVADSTDSTSSLLDEDVLKLNFKVSQTLNYEWRYTKDHAKWAVAIKDKANTDPWVCIADLNRMVSQEKRGGGSICFQDRNLWEALVNAEEKLHLQNQDKDILVSI